MDPMELSNLWRAYATGPKSLWNPPGVESVCTCEEMGHDFTPPPYSFHPKCVQTTRISGIHSLLMVFNSILQQQCHNMI